MGLPKNIGPEQQPCLKHLGLNYSLASKTIFTLNNIQKLLTMN
jgi:hypothetical protein